MKISNHLVLSSGVLATLGLALASGAQAQQAAPPADAAPGLEFAFEEIVTLGPIVKVGPTARGGRTIIPITGGSFSGPEIRGEVMPGGWDWQLLRNDGCTELEADYMLRTHDGTVINVLNKGVACPPAAGEASAGVRTVAVFEAPIGAYDWMSKSAFVGMLVPYESPGGPAVKIRFYRVR